MRPGGVYVLRGRVPYDALVAGAKRQPTPGRRVLWLIDRCMDKHRAVTVTVTGVPERHGDVWMVAFVMGDQSSETDQPVYLAKCGDYTFQETKQAIRGDPELSMPLPGDLAKARAKARERRVNPQREAIGQSARWIGELRTDMLAMKGRNRKKLIERELANLASELPALLGDNICLSDRTERQVPADANGDARPSGSDGLVRDVFLQASSS